MFDHLFRTWHGSVMDGDYAQYWQAEVYFSKLWSEWCQLTDDEPLDRRTHLLCTPIVETLLKVGPALATQALVFCDVNLAKTIGNALRDAGRAHRKYLDQEELLFGDTFGVAIFKGKRIEALAERHLRDSTGGDYGLPLRAFSVILSDIQEAKEERRLAGGAHVDEIPEFQGNLSAHRNVAQAWVRYWTYVATIQHDIARTLLKKHFFISDLNEQERSDLDYYACKYTERLDLLSGMIEKPIRYDTRIRFAIYSARAPEALDLLRAFETKYTEASLVDHAILTETKMLYKIYCVEDQDGPRMRNEDDVLKAEELRAEFTILRDMIDVHGFTCFGINLNLLAEKLFPSESN